MAWTTLLKVSWSLPSIRSVGGPFRAVCSAGVSSCGVGGAKGEIPSATRDIYSCKLSSPTRTTPKQSPDEPARILWFPEVVPHTDYRFGVETIPLQSCGKVWLLGVPYRVTVCWESDSAYGGTS